MPHVPVWFNTSPVELKCPYCKAEITTRIKHTANKCTWCCCWSMVFCGLILGCCLIPFKIDCCQDYVHHCPKCGEDLGETSKCRGHVKYFKQLRQVDIKKKDDSSSSDSDSD